MICTFKNSHHIAEPLKTQLNVVSTLSSYSQWSVEKAWSDPSFSFTATKINVGVNQHVWTTFRRGDGHWRPISPRASSLSVSACQLSSSLIPRHGDMHFWQPWKPVIFLTFTLCQSESDSQSQADVPAFEIHFLLLNAKCVKWDVGLKCKIKCFVEKNESGDGDNLCLCQWNKYGYAQNVRNQSAESALWNTSTTTKKSPSTIYCQF